MRRNEAAKKVLSKALYDQQAVLPMLRQCDPEDFLPDLLPVFLSIREAALEGTEVSVEILADKHPRIKDQLLSLVIEETTGSDQAYWVKRLKECTEEERGKKAVGRIQGLLLKDERPYGAKKAEIRLLWERAMADGREPSRLVTAQEMLEEEVPTEFYSVGSPAWEELTGGLSGGTIHVLAGR